MSSNDELNLPKRARQSYNKKSKIEGQEGSEKGKKSKYKGLTNGGKRKIKLMSTEKNKAASHGPMRASKSHKPKGKFKRS